MKPAGLKPSNPAKPDQQEPAGSRGLRRGLKIIAASVLGLLVLCVIGLVIYLKTLDVNTYKPLIQDAVLKASGRTLAIDGKMGLSISLHPSLTAAGVHLANGPGFSRANMVNIGRMQIEISVLPLLFGQLKIKHIVLFHPDILLETKADGSDNWDFSKGNNKPGMSTTSEAKPGSTILIPQIHQLTIRDAKLGYRNATNGQTHSLDISRLELWQKGHASDAPLHLSASGEYDQVPLLVQGKLGSLHTLAADEPLDVALNADVPGAKLQVKGKVAHPLSGRGMVFGIDLVAPGLGKLGKLLQLPPALDVPLHLAMTLKNNKDGFDLQGLQASLGKSDLGGNVRLALWRPRVHVDAVLHSKRFSMKELLPSDTGPAPASGSGKAAEPQRVFPSTPLDLQFLSDFDANVVWKADQLSLPDAELENVDAKLTLDHGVLKIAPFKAQLAGGDVQMQALLLAQHSPPEADVVLTGRHIDSGQLVSYIEPEAEKGQSPSIEGAPLDADVKLRGSGASVADLMAHSNGRIKLWMGPGKIKGDALNIIGGDLLTSMADKLNPASERSPYMNLQCGVVHFRVDDGRMISNNGIAFETNRTNLISHGEINLHDESINLSIGTQPRGGLGLNLSNMVNVVRLGGTLAKPKVVMDVGKTGMAAARAAGAVATGGLSLLGEGFIDRVTADKSPCKTAMEMK